jgi:hypothetical protein
MDFDPQASCAMEATFNLPVCLQGNPDTLLLHAAVAPVVSYMAAHHIPKDEFDPPYVYRVYMPDWISANDVAALGRVTTAAVLRGLTIPTVLLPVYPPQRDLEVTADDVMYVAANAGAIADALGPLLTAMQAADGAGAVPVASGPNWWVVAGIIAAAGALSLVATAIYHNEKGPREAMERAA